MQSYVAIHAHNLPSDVTGALSARLASQKRNDFNLRNDDLALAGNNTEPCLQCVEVLKKLQEAAKAYLTGSNYGTFCTEIGYVFHGQLLDHLRKFQISASGGLVLTKYARCRLQRQRA